MRISFNDLQKWCKVYAKPMTSEIIFGVKEDEGEGGSYRAAHWGTASTLWAETSEELRENVREAVDCHFDETMDAPKVIRLHFVRDEVLAR